jgi:hypothetical protein
VYGRRIHSLAYLLFGPLNNPLFHSSSRDQAVYVHSLGLTNAMNAGHGLQVGLRIPIGVIETERRASELVERRENETTSISSHSHARISCLQIDSQTSTSS